MNPDTYVDAPQLWEEPARDIIASVQWHEAAGWSVSFSCRREGTHYSPADRYELLTLAELVDVLEAQAARLRGF